MPSSPSPTRVPRADTPERSPHKHPEPPAPAAGGAGPSAPPDPSLRKRPVVEKAGRNTKKKAKVADEPLGNGGCVAHVLANIGVYETDIDAKAELNSQIDKVLEQRQREVDPTFPRNRVGVEDDFWCAQIVGKTVRARGFHYKKIRIDDPEIDLRDYFVDDMPGGFMVDGVLNNECVVGGEKWAPDPMDPTDPAEDEERWRHAVAVVAGQVREQQGQCWAVDDCLWLGENNQPHKEKGYLRKIHKVFFIAPCTVPDTGCKGGCLKAHCS